MTKTDKNEEIIEALCHAFEMEVEKIENYLAASVNLDGLRAISLRVILEREVEDELEHARKLSGANQSLGRNCSRQSSDEESAASFSTAS